MDTLAILTLFLFLIPNPSVPPLYHPPLQKHTEENSCNVKHTLFPYSIFPLVHGKDKGFDLSQKQSSWPDHFIFYFVTKVYNYIFYLIETQQ